MVSTKHQSLSVDKKCECSGLVKLYLHIGHGKTGSSYLQSSFAISRDVLRARGVEYPIDEKRLSSAKQGRPTSGNLGNKSHDFIISMIDFHEKNSVLVSSEMLFNSVPGRKSYRVFDFIDEFVRKFPSTTSSILLFIRDPLDHVFSAYKEKIKGKGEIGSIEELLVKYNTPNSVYRLLSLARGRQQEIVVKNYRQHKKSLLPPTEAWLGIEPGTLLKPPLERVNRSMTWSEVRLQMAFNKRLGGFAASLIGHPLCNQLPDIAPEHPPVLPAVFEKFNARMTRDLEKLAPLIPEDEAYRLPTAEEARELFTLSDEQGDLTLSAEQIDVVADAISEHIQRGARERNVLRVKNLFLESKQAYQEGDRAAAGQHIHKALELGEKLKSSETGDDGLYDQIRAWNEGLQEPSFKTKGMAFLLQWLLKTQRKA